MSSSSQATRAQIGVALAVIYLVWGSTYLAIRYAVETIPPFFMGGLRFLSAGSILYTFLKVRGEKTPSMIEWRSALIVGAFLLVGGNGLVGYGERTVESGLAALMVSVVPLWMVFFAWIRPNGSKVKPRVIFGLGLGLFGVTLLVGPQIYATGLKASFGLVLLSIAPILWAYGAVKSKHLPLPASVFMVTAIEMVMGGCLLLIAGVLIGELQAFSWHTLSTSSILAFLYLIFVGALVGFSAFVWLIKNAPLAVAGTYAFVNPVVAVGLGWLIAGERLTTTTLLAGFTVLVSVILITTPTEPT